MDFNAPIFTEIRSSPREGTACLPPENEVREPPVSPHPIDLPTQLPTHICCQHGRQAFWGVGWPICTFLLQCWSVSSSSLFGGLLGSNPVRAIDHISVNTWRIFMIFFLVGSPGPPLDRFTRRENVTGLCLGRNREKHENVRYKISSFTQMDGSCHKIVELSQKLIRSFRASNYLSFKKKIIVIAHILQKLRSPTWGDCLCFVSLSFQGCSPPWHPK